MLAACQLLRAYGALEVAEALRQNVHMAHGKRQAHYIRQWRKHRGLTLEQLAERIGMTPQNLGKIEREKVPYNQHLLEALAVELRCDIPDLIMRNPEDPEGIWSIWPELQPTEQRQVVEIAKTIKRTGTGG